MNNLRKAASGWIKTVLFVEIELGLLKFYFVLMLLLELVELRFEILHLLGGFNGRDAEGDKSASKNQGESDNGEA